MHIAMRATAALSLAILFCGPASASTRVGPHRGAHRAAREASLSLYSIRARRRARTILQLELLELQKAHLDRVRQALQKRIPIDQLLSVGNERRR